MRVRLVTCWLISIVAILLLTSPSVIAQVIGTPTSTFVFDQPAPSAQVAQGYTYKIYIDGATTGQTLANVTCTAGSSATLQTCSAPFPAFTPGSHSVQLTAGNQAGESGKSVAFVFTLVAVPGVPTNIRIGSGS